ncbi:MAG: FtsX-like permease family protein [Acidimicrobiia bacterium]
MGGALDIGWYRFRATFKHRWGTYLALVLLIGLLGGLASGAVAAARRTQSSYPAFLAHTHPSDLLFPTALYGLNGATNGYDAEAIAKAAHLPHVKQLESATVLNSAVLQADGKELVPPPSAPDNFEVDTYASVDGLYITQDAVAITAGRMADPKRADQFVVSPAVAKLLGWHIGTVVRVAFYTNEQEAAPGPSGDQWRPHAYRTLKLTLVGIGVQDDAIIQDDVDALGANFSLFTPALTRQFLGCCAQSTTTGLVLDHGAHDLPAIEAELTKVNPVVTTHFVVPSGAAAKAERAVKPESIALAVFGLIAALATALIGGQMIGRDQRRGADDLAILRALGASPAMTTADGLVGVLGAIVIASALATGVAILISPFSPIGPVRPVYPSRGFAFDWTVLGSGFIVLTIVLGATALALAYGNTRGIAVQRFRSSQARPSYAARALATTNLPIPAATGIRFALEPGNGRTTVPIRSAILGTALALIVVVATLTFATSLQTLVSHPALYGWNWDYELAGGGGVGDMPQALTTKSLNGDHDIAAWTGVSFGTARIGSVTVPVLAGEPDAPVDPPMLSGHALEAPNQIVLGANTLAQLHRRIGDTVGVDLGDGKTVSLRIVGTASLPAVGGSGSGSDHLELGTGAVLDARLVPPDLRDPSGNTPVGPNAALVRFRAGADRAAARHGLQDIAHTLSLPTNWGVTVVPVQRPAEIVNYRSVSNTPYILGGMLAVGALLALALTLIASVRRRRHDLALLKTFGFTRVQLAAVIAWQATVSVFIGIALGVPLGILVGRLLWNVFAREIHVVPHPNVPALVITLIAVGAIVLANVVAAAPGIQAARTRTATLLQAE